MKITELQASDPIRYCTDKFSDHSYGNFYNELLYGKEDSDMSVIEIGIYQGGSVRLFFDYLKNAMIIGVDSCNYLCNHSPKHYTEDRMKIIFQDAYTRGLPAPYESMDIIIDDASHILQDQIYALANFPEYLKSGGILIIEDVPEGAEMELIKHTPAGGKFWIENLRHVKGRWDDCLVVFKKD